MASKLTKGAIRVAKEKEVVQFLTEQAAKEGERAEQKRNRAITLAVARDTYFLKQLEGVADKIAAKVRRTPEGFSKKAAAKREQIERHLTLILSDLHFRSMYDRREGPYEFGPTEEARRLAAVILQVAEYKLQHRKETTLLVNLLGDIIEGMLGHDPRRGAPLAEQIMAAIDLLVQALTFLASKFPKVIVRCVSGNHGRNILRHQGKATDSKWDSHETVVYFALKKALAHLKNVTVEIPLTPYFIYKSFDNHVFCTHGDTVVNAGYPNSAIKVKALEQAVTKINSTRDAKEKINLLVVGHVHCASYTQLPNGVAVITNAALPPAGGYDLANGRLETSAGQVLFESVAGHPVGDYRFIEVSRETDNDASLEKIIKPFTL